MSSNSICWNTNCCCLLIRIQRIFNIDVLIRFNQFAKNSEKEKYMINYLMHLFPIEFYTYFDTLSVTSQSHLSIPKKGDIETEDNHFIQKCLIKMKNKKSFNKKIQKRKELKSLINLSRANLKDNDEVEFIERCKETKIYKNLSLEKIVEVIQQISQLSFPLLSNLLMFLKFFNYLMTIALK